MVGVRVGGESSKKAQDEPTTRALKLLSSKATESSNMHMAVSIKDMEISSVASWVDTCKKTLISCSAGIESAVTAGGKINLFHSHKLSTSTTTANTRLQVIPRRILSSQHT
jgi:hypothetical protein